LDFGARARSRALQRGDVSEKIYELRETKASELKELQSVKKSYKSYQALKGWWEFK